MEDGDGCCYFTKDFVFRILFLWIRLRAKTKSREYHLLHNLGSLLVQKQLGMSVELITELNYVYYFYDDFFNCNLLFSIRSLSCSNYTLCISELSTEFLHLRELANGTSSQQTDFI